MDTARRRHRLFRRRPGEAPGTVSTHADAVPTTMRLMAYGPDDYVEQAVTDLSVLGPAREKWPVTWLNVVGLGDTATIRKIGEVLDLHPLALEDVVNVHQRPKVEPYAEHQFIVTRMVSFTDHLETEQVSLFLGKGYVVTFQETPGDCLDPVRDRIRKAGGRVRKFGADYLTYSLLDATIDAYFPVLENLGERLEDLEEEVIARPDAHTVGQVHAAKRDLLALRRAIWPQREAISALLREEMPLIAKATRVYLRDCYDHVSQIIDFVETYRELASGLLDAYQSSISNRMNEIMKVLTIIATIFIPLGFLAGVWGMNFNTDASPFNMPELNSRYGYPCALGFMALLGLGMLFIFWRQGWLGSSDHQRRRKADKDRLR